MEVLTLHRYETVFIALTEVFIRRQQPILAVVHDQYCNMFFGVVFVKQ